eukprot:357378-Pyramimonas_sp.AAC.1
MSIRQSFGLLGALTSGLVSLNVSADCYECRDGFQAILARKIRLYPVYLRPRGRRLKWVQNIVRWPLCNLQLMGALFGIAECGRTTSWIGRGTWRAKPGEWWQQ